MNKLSFLITRFPYESTMGGEEWHTVTIAEGVMKKGHEVFLASSCPHMLKLFQKKNIPHQKVWGGLDLVSKKAFFLFPFTAPFYITRLWIHLIWHKLFRKVNRLYCLTLNDKLFLTPLAKLLGMKVFWIHHTTIGKWLQQNPFLFLYRFFAKRVTIICPSQFIAKQIQDLGIPEKHFKVILNGFDDEKFSSKPKLGGEQFWENVSEMDTAYSLQLTADTKRIGSVCRLSHEKGLNDLIQAAKICVSKNPHLQFFVVGDGPQKEDLETLIHQNGLENHLFLLGFQDYEFINDFLHHIDLFVLPSHEEPFGIVLHEARYCKTPIIATRVGGIPEHVEDGVDGILVDPHNAEVLSLAILDLLEDNEKRKRLIENGFKKMEQQFTKSRMVEEWEMTLKH